MGGIGSLLVVPTFCNITICATYRQCSEGQIWCSCNCALLIALSRQSGVGSRSRGNPQVDFAMCRVTGQPETDLLPMKAGFLFLFVERGASVIFGGCFARRSGVAAL